MLSMKVGFEVLTAVTTKITVLWGCDSWFSSVSTDVSEEEAASTFRADGKNRFL